MPSLVPPPTCDDFITCAPVSMILVNGGVMLGFLVITIGLVVNLLRVWQHPNQRPHHWRIFSWWLLGLALLVVVNQFLAYIFP